MFDFILPVTTTDSKDANMNKIKVLVFFFLRVSPTTAFLFSVRMVELNLKLELHFVHVTTNGKSE